MSSSPLMMDYEGGRPTAGWRPVAGCWVAAQACVCRLCGDLNTAWRLSLSDEMRVRGVLYMRRALQIDVFTFLPFTLTTDHCLYLCVYLRLVCRSLVSASQDGKLIVWDGYTTNKVRHFVLHTYLLKVRRTPASCNMFLATCRQTSFLQVAETCCKCAVTETDTEFIQHTCSYRS